MQKGTKSILITGCNGLIGSHSIIQLVKDGFPCIGIDKKRCPDTITDWDFKQINLLDKNKRRSIIKNIQGCIHLASICRIEEAENNPDECIETNVNGTADLLDDLSKLKSPPWLIYASSREVYGNSDRFPVKEIYPVQSINIYAKTKIQAERLVRSYSIRTGRPAIIFRFSNVYGGIHDYPDRVIPAFINAAFTGKSIIVRGAEKSFDFTYIDDVSKVISRAVFFLQPCPDNYCKVLNVCTGQETRLTTIASLICSEVGKKVEIKIEPYETFEVIRYVGDPHCLYEELKIKCETDIKTGIARYVKDCKDFRRI